MADIILNPLADAVFPSVTISYTGIAGVTDALPAGPNSVQVLCTTNAYVIVGEGVTATATNGMPVAANIPEVLKVPKGTGAPWRVSAIQVAAGGNLYVKALAN